MKQVFIALFLGLSLISFGQNKEGKKGEKKAEKKAFITSAINLSNEQAPNFWTIYDEYSKKRKALQKEKKSLLKGQNFDNISEEEAKNILGKMKTLQLLIK